MKLLTQLRERAGKTKARLGGDAVRGWRNEGMRLARVLELDALRLLETSQATLDVARVRDVLDGPLNDLSRYVGIALSRLSQGHGCSFMLRLLLRLVV